MNEQRIAELVEKYLDNSATEAERQELLDWYKSVDHSEIVWPESEDQFDKRLERIKENILPSLRREKRQNRSKKLYISILSAAAVLIAVITGVFLYTNKDSELLSASHKETFISPGGNKAVLTLSDGTVFNLGDTLQNFDFSEQNGFRLRAKEGELTFENHQTPALQSAQPTYSTLSTPRGGQYVVNLPDGSKVWLNAESSLFFPNVFAEDERKVTLSGEAYFDINKKPKAPFTVSIQDLDIEVLGTEFNVNAYSNPTEIATTLIEGSVKLSSGSKSVFLKPNQQSIWSKENQSFTTQDIDTKSITGWKNGYFVFNNTNISVIMAELARWYDIEVSYEGDISQKEYTGSILRRSNIQDVLDMLELTETIKFKIEGRRIIVIP